jgi:hypothetical protein
MDALAFCVVICVGIGIISLFVKIFNKGKSLSHAKTDEECYGVVHTILTKPEYDDIPGNIYYDEFRN